MVSQIDDASGSASITYNNPNNWLALTASGWYDNTYHFCRPNTQLSTSCSVTISFTGSEAGFYGNAIGGRGRFYCYLDDESTASWVWYDGNSSGGEALQVKWCGVTGLDGGSHTLTVGQEYADALENALSFDYYEFGSDGTGTAVTWTSNQPTTAAPVNFVVQVTSEVSSEATSTTAALAASSTAPTITVAPTSPGSLTSTSSIFATTTLSTSSTTTSTSSSIPTSSTAISTASKTTSGFTTKTSNALAGSSISTTTPRTTSASTPASLPSFSVVGKPSRPNSSVVAGAISGSLALFGIIALLILFIRYKRARRVRSHWSLTTPSETGSVVSTCTGTQWDDRTSISESSSLQPSSVVSEFTIHQAAFARLINYRTATANNSRPHSSQSGAT